MTDEFDELIGGAPEPAPPPRRNKGGRPTNEERARRQREASGSLEMQAAIRAAGAGKTRIDAREFMLPVGQNFLAEVFRMDPMTVRKRLLKCKPVGYAGGNRAIYDFPEAASYIVKPKMTAEEFARTLNKADLPPEINKAFWDSQRSRVKYKIEAQEAWETEDVVAVLGEVAMLFKDSTTMVVEEMRSRAKLSDEQTEILQECFDELRREIRKKLIDMPSKRRTASMFDKPMFGISREIDAVPEGGWLEDDADDDEGDE